MASRSSALAGFEEDQADEDVAGAHRLVVKENVRPKWWPPVAPDGMMGIPILRPNAQAHVRVRRGYAADRVVGADFAGCDSERNAFGRCWLV